MKIQNPVFTKLLWLLLLLTLTAAATSSMSLRIANERANHTILSVIDYENFSASAMQSNLSTEELLTRLHRAGIHTVAVKETSLREMAVAGQIYLDTYGNFLSYAQGWNPSLYTWLTEQTAASAISPYALIAISSEPKTTAFLTERLANRFIETEWMVLEHGNQTMFFIYPELSPLNPNVNGDTLLDVRVGFRPEVLDLLQTNGFDIILRPGKTAGSNAAYRAEYEQFIADYHVKTIIFANTVLKATPEDIAYFADLTRQYQLTLGVIENSNQILYIEQEGLNALMEATDYPINRTYSTSSDDYVKQTSERYYRWVRAVIDRGLRIMYIQPFKDVTRSTSQNLNDTLEIIQQFQQTMEGKGFSVTGELPTLDASRPGMMNRLLIALSLAAGVLLYIRYLLPLKPRLFQALTLLILASTVLIHFTGMDLTKVYALGAAVLYPSLSGLLVLLFLKARPRSKWISKMILSFLILLSVNALGMITLVTSLSDLRFIMYVKTFSGVKIAFMLPLLLFIVNYFMVFYRDKNIVASLLEISRMRPTYLVLGVCGLLVIALYIYLGRSGNDSGITVSTLELRVREILEMVFLARPRFKEILIGYPCLAMMVYLYHRYRYPLFLLLFGLGMMMGSISMTNTFCHVFAAVQISASRTLAGIWVGMLISIGCLLVLRLAELLFLHYFPQFQPKK